MKIIIAFLIVSFLFSCSGNPQDSASISEKSAPLSEETTQKNESQVFKQDEASDQPNANSGDIESKASSSKSTTRNKTVNTNARPSNDGITSKLVEDITVETKMIKVDFSGVYNEILKNFVSASGKVNYSAIKTTREMLSQATQHFEENPPESSWSRNEKLAYWINAYNLYTIELIVDNYPVKSIKDIANGKPWDKKFIQLGGKTLSLNDIENGIIRKEFNEPRIHFAVNCASISCPKLLNKAYTASNLNVLLDSQTKRFINDNAMNTLSEKSIEISNLFEWYSSDFGNVITFLNKYAEVEISPTAKITYKNYNWNLNN